METTQIMGLRSYFFFYCVFSYKTPVFTGILLENTIISSRSVLVVGRTQICIKVCFKHLHREDLRVEKEEHKEDKN